MDVKCPECGAVVKDVDGRTEAVCGRCGRVFALRGGDGAARAPGSEDAMMADLGDSDTVDYRPGTDTVVDGRVHESDVTTPPTLELLSAADVIVDSRGRPGDVPGCEAETIADSGGLPPQVASPSDAPTIAAAFPPDVIGSGTADSGEETIPDDATAATLEDLRSRNETHAYTHPPAGDDTQAGAETVADGSAMDSAAVTAAKSPPCPTCGSHLTRFSRDGQVNCRQCGADLTSVRGAGRAGRGTAKAPDESAAGPVTRQAEPGLVPKQPGSLKWLSDNLSDDYEVLEFLGRGGMGAVYKARQKNPPRTVALKVMLGGALASDRGRKRFEREAMAAARVQHPGIVPVYEVGEVAGQPYYTMAFVDGVDLREYVSIHHVDRREVCRLLIQVCEAVDFAHTSGIIHRDLKPGNVMVDGSGRCRVLDFGLARVAREEGEEGEKSILTVSGDVLGTPRYMSPEQASGDPRAIDGSTDVYSLGVILYELTVGMPPYNVEGVKGLRALEIVRKTEPLRPSQIHHLFPADLEAILLKAIEKEKRVRYRTAVALAEDLENFLADRPVSAQPPTTIYRLKKFTWRNRKVILPVVAGLLLLALVTGILGGLYWRQSREDAKKELLRAMQLLTFQEVRPRVMELVAQGEWYEASIRADQAQDVFPQKAGLYGILDEVRELASEHVEQRVVEVDGLIRAQDYQRARERAEALGPLAARMPFDEPKRKAALKSESFAEDCWGDLQTVFDEAHVYTREPSVAHVEGYLAAFAEDAHAAEAAAMLARVRNEPDAYFLQQRLVATEREMSHYQWEIARAVLAQSDGVIQAANVEDKPEWRRKFDALRRELGSVIWSATARSVGVVERLSGHTGLVKSVAFRPGSGGLELASGSADGTVRLWSLDSATAPKVLQCGSQVHAVAFSGDGALLAAGCQDGTVHVWRLENMSHKSWSCGLSGRLNCVDLSPDGRVLLTGSAGGVKLWDLSGEEPVEVRLLDGARSPAVLLPGAREVAAAMPGGDLGVWRTDSAAIARRIPNQNLPQSLAVSPDGSKLAAGCRDHQDNEDDDDHLVRLWDVKSGELTAEWRAHTRPVGALAFSADGRTLASGSQGKDIKLWDVSPATAKPAILKLLDASNTKYGWTMSLSFSEDGRRFASGSNADKVVRIWAVTRKPVSDSPDD